MVVVSPVVAVMVVAYRGAGRAAAARRVGRAGAWSSRAAGRAGPARAWRGRGRRSWVAPSLRAAERPPTERVREALPRAARFFPKFFLGERAGAGPPPPMRGRASRRPAPAPRRPADTRRADSYLRGVY